MKKQDKIWLDGKFVDWDQANVHILTHTLHYGFGVFEGTRCYKCADGSAIFRLEDHLRRLYNSAHILTLELPFTMERMIEASKLIVEEIMSNPLRRRELTMRDAQSLAVIGGIGVQNGQLLSGQPTQRVEVHEVQTPEHDDFNAYLAKLPKANLPAMGLTGGISGQKGGGETGAHGTSEGAAPGTDGPKPVVDVQSELSRENNQ